MKNPLIYLLEKYPDKDWSWFRLSKNPNVTMDFVNSHPDKPWSWYGLSWNPNVTMDYVDSHPDKPWSWWGLSRNKFTLQNKINQQKEEDAARKIWFDFWLPNWYKPPYGKGFLKDQSEFFNKQNICKM